MKRRSSIKGAAFLGILLLASRGAAAGGQRILKGIFEPEMIKVDGESLFIVEGANILEYSLKDLRIVRRFGGKGEGPGELKVLDFWYNKAAILPDRVFVDGYRQDHRFRERRPIGP